MLPQPLAIIDNKGAVTGSYDPYADSVLDLLRKREPRRLTVDLMWPSAVIGVRKAFETFDNEYDVLLYGAQSDLKYSRVSIKKANGNYMFSPEPVPIYSISGGVGNDRQPYHWNGYLYLPAKQRLIVEATLAENAPGSGAPEASGTLIFYGFVVSK